MIKDEWRSLMRKKPMRAAIVIVMILPAIFAGIFLGSMWDPYGMSDGLSVAVVNYDKSVEFKGITLSIGDNLVENLKDNTSMNFVEKKEQTAKDGLRSGKYYMVITIPEDFSKNASTVLDKAPKKMNLKYETNPGTNYLASKVSDTAVSNIEKNVTEQVTRQYSKAIFTAFGKTSDGIKNAATGSDNLVSGVNNLKAGTATLSSKMKNLTEGTLNLVSGSKKLQTGVSSYTAGVSKVKTGSESMVSGTKSMSKGIDSLSGGVNKLKSGSDSLSSGVSTLSTNAGKLKSASSSLASSLGGTKSTAAAAAANASDVKTKVDTLTGDMPASDTDIDSMDEAAAKSKLKQLLADSSGLSAAASNAASNTGTVQGDLNRESGQAGGLDSGVTSLISGIGNLETGASNMSAGISTLAANTVNLQSGSAQLLTGANSLLKGSSTLDSKSATLKEGTANLVSGSKNMQSGVSKMSSGVSSMSSGVSKLDSGATKLNTRLKKGAKNADSNLKNVSSDTYDMFSSPVKTTKTEMTSVENMGNSMAAFLLSVGIWVGAMAFSMLYPIAEMIARRKNGLDYWKRSACVYLSVSAAWGLAIVPLINIFLDIEPRYYGLTLLTAAVGAMAFVSIVNFINLWLGKPATGLVLLLLVLQLSSAGGIFPIEMTSKFYQVMHPYMPFTYTVNAFRSTIANGNSIVFPITVLILIAVIFNLFIILVANKKCAKGRSFEDAEKAFSPVV